ncbi:MAG: hypothetical protein E7040_03885 [Lentisphaerae bacterium]|nr:hypothetical protein [Lentisphaerota bacterium]
MADGIKNYAGSSERSKIAMKLAILALIESLFFTILALIASYGNGWSGIGTFTMGVIPFGVAVIFSVAAIFYGLLSGNAAEEEYEKELLKKRKESLHSIMDVSEDVRFTAGRTFANYLKKAPQVFCIIALLFVALSLLKAYGTPAAYGAVGLPAPKNPMVLAFVCVISAAVALFTGMFLSGQSRMNEFRWLRPIGAWFVAGAFVWLLAAVSAVALHYKNPGWDLPIAKVVFVVLAILGAEFIFSFVAEFYRPRTQVEDRPVHESRILAIFIDPGSVAKNIANTLDYQFGFKVSGTWLFQKFCKVALPAIFVWLVVFWLFTCIGEVGPGEVGIKTRFGKLVSSEPLQPGLYFKLPWPCDKISRIKIDEPRVVTIGVEAKKDTKAQPEKAPLKTILWTKEHEEGEMPFLVANSSSAQKTDKNSGSSQDLGNAVSMLNAVLPVTYKVNKDKVMDYFLNYRNVDQALLDLGTQEATIYFASTDFNRDLAEGRKEITKNLTERIQKRADEWNLGVTILSVDLNGTHPPVKDVAAAFQGVFIAEQKMETEIEKAETYKLEKDASAKVKEMQIKQEADTYKYKRTTVSEYDAREFQSKLAAYKAMPSMFKLRTYLSFLENDCADLRKYILSATIPYQILELNAEEKPRLDLLDADLGGNIN